MTRFDAAARADADDGVTHRLVLDGRAVVSVTEDQPNDTDLGVTFTSLCLRRDGKLQGFVTIRSQVGGNDDLDEEGFHVLYVARGLRTRPFAQPPIGPIPEGFALKSEEAGESVHADAGHLAGDLRIAASGKDPVRSVRLTAGGEQRSLAFTQEPRTGAVLLRNVPLTKGRLEVTTASGKTSSLEVEALAPDPRIRSTEAGDAIDLELATRYARFDDEGLTDRRSPFAAFVNEALRKRDPAALMTIFHSTQPLTTVWQIDATDVATGAAVPIDVSIARGAFGAETAHVRFPAERRGAVEVRAQATVTDATGQSGSVTHRVRRR